MTKQENLQVAQYIAGLKAEHEVTMQDFRVQCQTYFDAMQAQHNGTITGFQLRIENDTKQHAWELEQQQKMRSEALKQLESSEHNRKIANNDRDRMGQAVHEIWKLANSQSTTAPQQFAVYVRQIINHYCPDFDIPY